MDLVVTDLVVTDLVRLLRHRTRLYLQVGPYGGHFSVVAKIHNAVATIHIEIGITCGAERIGQIAFFVSRNII